MGVLNIAIDGPSGAGKSTISKILADRLGFTYVDTGAIYRAIGLYMDRLGIDCQDRKAVTAHLPELAISVMSRDGVQHTLLGGEDVSEAIRQHSISACASKVSVHPEVRDFLLALQRDLALSTNCIMDGRDIGTVVLPNADLKIFLTASPEDRAMRRHRELLAKGENLDYEQILEDIKLRDERDSNREAAPLKPASDSVAVDTSGNTLEQSVERILELVRTHLNLPGGQGAQS